MKKGMQKGKHLTLLILVFLLLAACSSTTELITATQSLGESIETNVLSDEGSYLVKEAPCNRPPGGDEIEGETVICGTVNVPENYDDPTGNQIPLAYAVLKASGDLPAAEPVLFLHGGPGSGELMFLEKLVEDFATIRQDRDVVIFDQRGAGFSNTLTDCSLELIDREVEITTAVAQAPPDDVENVQQLEIVRICAETAKQRGVDLAQYNTVNNAHDAQSLKTALGYDAFNLYGFSYGTTLALEIMRQEPEGLLSVVLDSTIPPNVKMHERPSEPAIEAVQALFTACINDTSCNAAYPNLEVRFSQLMVQLEESPIALNDDQSITPVEIVALINMRNNRDNYTGLGISAYLPLLITEIERGVTDTYIGLTDDTLIPPPSYEDDEYVDDEDNAPEVTLAENFYFAANSTESLQTDLDAKRAYYALLQQPAAQVNLLDFINEYIPAAENVVLLETAQAMGDDDVTELFALIRKFAGYQHYAAIANITFPLHLFTCNESIPFNTMEGAEAYIESAPISAIASGMIKNVENSMNMCGDLPTGLASADFHNPVSSDIPTLVMVGLNDTQTAPSWGRIALETLPNGQLATFPESGHGTFQFSQCARDVGAAFLIQPDAILDTSCTDGLRPEFVLP